MCTSTFLDRCEGSFLTEQFSIGSKLAMLDQDGLTVVFLFSFWKYLQYFHIGYKFPH